MKNFPLSDSLVLPFAPSIAGVISDYLQSATQEIYINLRFNNDKIVTQPAIKQILIVPNCYSSPIAHQLSEILQLTPLEICKLMHAPVKSAVTAPQILLDCWYSDSGYIYFQLTPSAVAFWLNYLATDPQCGSVGVREHNRETANDLEPALALYAHARCCSLLKLASTEKLIATADRSQMTPADWLTIDSDRGHNRPPTDRMLIFVHPAEYRLIHAFLDILDGIHSNKTQRWSKLVLYLAQRWLEFDRDCQTFGDVQRQNPRLATARCGLTSIARTYLRVLLEEYLGTIAPTEF
jgi:hypothetical protein